ncbi:hypothetical protein KDI_35520 [Dictyobacter arantiisoli]|uniref:Uncharacterized protein n=1 Tax=Dictyobacter arantiisoli TaxID=2014874 RepID=A0A5A5TFH7_9CHLR|nr:hypothetical protein KDI_35520 [Dictyobacter arantiisoli]
MSESMPSLSWLYQERVATQESAPEKLPAAPLEGSKGLEGSKKLHIYFDVPPQPERSRQLGKVEEKRGSVFPHLESSKRMSALNSDLEQMARFGPLDKIYSYDFAEGANIRLQGSRGKHVYLFDQAGECTGDKAQAQFMVDPHMSSLEYRNYRLVQSWGIRTPELYGQTAHGAVVEWISDQHTIGGRGYSLVSQVRNIMKLHELNPGNTSREFETEKWQQTLADVNTMIEQKYTSKDLQFMIHRQDGHVYVMDLEANNTPCKGKVADSKLLALKSFLEASIKQKAVFQV